MRQRLFQSDFYVVHDPATVDPLHAARRTDPEESRAAANKILKLGGQRRKLLRVYYEHTREGGLPLSDHEASELAGLPSRSCWWKRCGELLTNDLIEKVTTHKDRETGQWVRACVITRRGCDWLREVEVVNV